MQVAIPVHKGSIRVREVQADNLLLQRMCAIRGREDAPGIDEPFALVAGKGCHSRGTLKALPDPCRSRISELKHRG